MAEPLSGGKRIGPFTGKQWAIGIVGGGGGYLLYRWYENRQASNAAAAQTASTAGSTIPAGESQSSGTAAPATIAAWQQAALGYGSNPIETLNAVTNWLAGNCVDSTGYGGVTAAIQALGLPPGLTTIPILTVCTTPTGTSSSTPAAQTTPTPANTPAVQPGGNEIPATTYSPGALISSLTAAGYTVGNSPTDTVQTQAIPVAVAPGNKVVTTQGPSGPIITVEQA